MPVTVDKLLGKALLHSHKLADILDYPGGVLDSTSVTTVTTNTLVGAYNIVLVDASAGNVTISLPAAASVNNQNFEVKKIDSTSNLVIIDADGSETIDGDTTMTLAFQNSAIDLVSNGTSWYII